MNRQIGSLLGALLAAAAPGVAGAQGTGFPAAACPAGVPTAPSSAAVRAQRAMLLGRGSEAMAGARAAAQAQPGNPFHQLLLGRTLAAALELPAADSAFQRAVALCPALAGEVAADRERGFLAAFQQGLDAYQASDTLGAMARWESANAFYQGRPDAWYNLGVVRTHRREHEAAAHAFKQALSVLAGMPADTSAAEQATRLEARQNAVGGLLMVGSQLFARDQLAPAGEIFAYLTAQDPHNRDAWYNYALALYKSARWGELLPVSDRLTRIDPLDHNAQLLLFNAHRSLAQGPQGEEHHRQALAILQRADSLPVYLEEVRFTGEGALGGRAVGNTAPPGQPLTLTFTFWGPQGEAGAASVVVPAPARGEKAAFQLALPPGAVTSYSYTYR